MIIKEITGCDGCPALVYYDISGGWGCKLIPSTPENYISQSKKNFLPETPDWCPLKKESITLTFKK